MSFNSNIEAPYFSIVLNQTHDSTKLKAVKIYFAKKDLLSSHVLQ